MTAEKQPPFIDDGNGFPTPESVRTALGMFSLSQLADMPVNFRGEQGPMVELVAQCQIEHLTKNWPKGFIAQVVGTARQAAQQASQG